MKKFYLYMVMVLFFSVQAGSLFAQNPSLTLDKISDNPVFKQKYEEAELLMLDNNFPKALELYLTLDSISPRNANINYKIGICLLYSLSEKDRSVEYFQLAVKNISEDYVGNYDELTAPPDALFYLGKAYHIDYKLDKAVQTFEQFKKYVIDSEVMEEVDRYITMCETAKAVINNPLSIKIENLGKNVNSKYSDYSPVIAYSKNNEPTLIFTSRREGSTGGKLDQEGRYFEDIYITYKNQYNDWIPAIKIGSKINTNTHEATISISHDGNKLFIYKNDNGDGNIYCSDFVNGDWDKPKALDKTVNTEFWETHACLSPDGTTLYFTSNKPEGFGGRDLYKAILSSEGKWINVENLGPTVNTKYDEDAPYILADGVTLYFASNGHNTMGGFDIFNTTVDMDGFWAEPENIGYPINTTEDDVFYAPTPDEKHAFYSSAKNNGFGEQDIYYISIIKEKKRMITLNGIIADITDREPIPVSELIIKDTKNKEFKKVININNNDNGAFSIEVSVGTTYEFIASAEGYETKTEVLNIDPKERKKEITQDIYLERMEVAVIKDTIDNSDAGKSFVLKNIFFDFDKSSLREESIVELQNVYQIMKDYPKLKVEISGHTDNKGSNEYNKSLSMRRAQVVVDWLVKKGINKDRLVAKGYGEEQPITTNDTNEGRQENRRTEFKILEK